MAPRHECRSSGRHKKGALGWSPLPFLLAPAVYARESDLSTSLFYDLDRRGGDDLIGQVQFLDEGGELVCGKGLEVLVAGCLSGCVGVDVTGESLLYGRHWSGRRYGKVNKQGSRGWIRLSGITGSGLLHGITTGLGDAFSPLLVAGSDVIGLGFGLFAVAAVATRGISAATWRVG